MGPVCSVFPLDLRPPDTTCGHHCLCVLVGRGREPGRRVGFLSVSVLTRSFLQKPEKKGSELQHQAATGLDRGEVNGSLGP